MIGDGGLGGSAEERDITPAASITRRSLYHRQGKTLVRRGRVDDIVSQIARWSEKSIRSIPQESA